VNPDAIEAILGDFRTWLVECSGQCSLPAAKAAEPVDLFTLVGQFTALRHEVNMQTKAARAAVEQNAEALKQLSAIEPDDPAESLRPIVKGIVDVADALNLSLRQLESLEGTAEPLLEAAEQAEQTPPRPGFWVRLLGTKGPDASANPSLDKLRQLIAAAADGYTLSIRRIERLLPTLELEPQPCLGEPFDPETMEAVEVVGDAEYPSGTVIEEVRPGYLWRGKVFRFAQVKVAR
jgi:molecular chaperone GrpE